MARAGEAPKGPNRANMPLLHKPGRREMWECRVCGAKNSDAQSENCINCGRDYWGNPGSIPKKVQPHRPALRGD